MDPDQDGTKARKLGLRIGDVVAFHRTLTAQHVRRVGFFAALAEDE